MGKLKQKSNQILPFNPEFHSLVANLTLIFVCLFMSAAVQQMVVV